MPAPELRTPDQATRTSSTMRLFYLLLASVSLSIVLNGASRLPHLYLTETLTTLPQGIYLIRGLPRQDLSFSMPFVPFLGTVYYALPPWAENILWPLFYVLMSLTALALGQLLSSTLCGFFAMLLTAHLLSLPAVQDMFSSLGSMAYALSCTTVVLALLLRGTKPRRWHGEILTAMLIGASFTIKSPLAFLPPLLAAYDIATGRLKRGETSAGKLAVLSLLPYAMLLPWIYMNYRLDHVLRLFEGGRADENIITGALGIVYTVEGAYPIANLPHDANYLLWAAKTIAKQPLVYIGGVLSRLLTIATWAPGFLTIFAASAIRSRRREEFRLILFFTCYYTLLLSLLSIQKNYFGPLFITALTTASTLFCTDKSKKPKRSRFARYLLLSLCCLLMSGYLAVSAYLIAYPSRLAAADPAAQIPRVEFSENPILLVHASEAALAEGHAPLAYAYARSALLQRHSPITAEAYLRALSALNIDIEPPLRNRLLTRTDNTEQMRLLMLQTCSALKKNELEKASALLAKLRAEWGRRHLSFTKITSLREAALYRKQQENDTIFADTFIPGMLGKLSPAQRGEFSLKLQSLGVRSNRMKLLELDSISQTKAPKSQILRRITEMSGAVRNEDSKAYLLHICLREGFSKEARDHARQFLKDNDSARLRFYLVDALINLGELQAAQRQVDRVKSMALSLVERNWLSELEQKLLEYPQRREAEAAQGIKKLINDARYPEAAHAAKAFLSRHDSITVRFYLADILLRTNDLRAAQKQLDILALKKLALPEQKWLSDLNLVRDSHSLKAIELIKRKQFGPAMSLAQTLAQLSPNVSIILDIADALIDAKEYALAQTLLNKIARAKLSDQDLSHISRLDSVIENHNLSMLHNDRNFEALISASRQALKANPANLSARLYLSIAYAESGDLERADKELSLAAKNATMPWQKQWVASISKRLSVQLINRSVTLLPSWQRKYSRANHEKFRQTAQTLINSRQYHVRGLLYMAKLHLEGGDMEEAQKILSALRNQRLDDNEKKWMHSMQLAVRRYLDEKSLQEESLSLKQLEINNANPAALLVLAKKHVKDYPESVPGRLYYAYGLISDRKFRAAKQELKAAEKFGLSPTERQWTDSLLELMAREQDKCAWDTPAACMRKLLKRK